MPIVEDVIALLIVAGIIAGTRALYKDYRGVKQRQRDRQNHA